MVRHELKVLDADGGVSFGAAFAGSLFEVTYEDDGRLVLTPMEAVPASSYSAETLASIDRGLADIAAGRVRMLDLSTLPADEE